MRQPSLCLAVLFPHSLDPPSWDFSPRAHRQWLSAVAQQKQCQLLVSPGDWSYGHGLPGVNKSCWALGSLLLLAAQLLGDTNWRHNPSFGELDFEPCAATPEVTKNAEKSPHVPESSKYSHSAGLGAPCRSPVSSGQLCLPGATHPSPRGDRADQHQDISGKPQTVWVGLSWL